MRRIFLAPAMALLSLRVLAQEAVTVEGQKNPDDVVTCVHSDPPLGSHMGAGKECHTKAEWQKREIYLRQSRQDYANWLGAAGSHQPPPR